MIDPAPRYFSDPTHPVWSLLRVAVMTIALVAVLKFTASKIRRNHNCLLHVSCWGRWRGHPPMVPQSQEDLNGT